MRKQILLIDDDLPLCRQIRDALQDDTTEVRYFIDTAEALDSFMRHRYCLVINLVQGLSAAASDEKHQQSGAG